VYFFFVFTFYLFFFYFFNFFSILKFKFSFASIFFTGFLTCLCPLIYKMFELKSFSNLTISQSCIEVIINFLQHFLRYCIRTLNYFFFQLINVFWFRFVDLVLQETPVKIVQRS
ncbi:hypothetical protein DD595_24945, partial [Enterobacter cloacae complex sp. 4DZ3-17B2]